MTPNHKCLVCNSEDIEFHLKCKDHLAGKEFFRLHKCQACGFIFTANPPGELEILKYYDTGDYVSHSDTKKGLLNTLFHYTRSLMLYRKSNIIRKTTGLKRGTLLDIGCGTGYFGSFMKERDWNVHGIEPNDRARDFAVNSFKLKVSSGIENSDLLEKYFDCITLWHVFEHFNEPGKYLSLIQRILKPGAVCIIAMPNCISFDARHYNEYWAAWDVPRHLWHFSPDVFQKYAEKYKFRVTGIFKLPADVFYISMLSERYRGTNLPLLSGFMKGLWFSFLTLFNKKGSSSLIYILRT